jgi:hypothetical protein
MVQGNFQKKFVRLADFQSKTRVNHTLYGNHTEYGIAGLAWKLLGAWRGLARKLLTAEALCVVKCLICKALAGPGPCKVLELNTLRVKKP